jgi:hypothetical protein
VKFREMDFWQDLADDFNTMIERVGSQSSDAGGSPAIEAEAGALVGK